MRQWICLALLGCIVIAGSTRELFADSLVLNNDTSLLASVNMTYTPPPVLVPPFSNGDYYAGALKWTDTTTSTTFNSFCIDINHDVNLGGSYTMTPGQSLSPTLSANVIGAIYYLFGNVPNPFATNVIAGEFQVAIWDLIYNFGSGLTPLAFTPDGGSVGLTSGQLTAAHGLAVTAWGQQIALANLDNNPNLKAILITGSDGGQAQVYIGPIGAPLPTPVPSSVSSGLVLLGLVGICVKSSRKRKSRFPLN